MEIQETKKEENQPIGTIHQPKPTPNNETPSSTSLEDQSQKQKQKTKIVGSPQAQKKTPNFLELHLFKHKTPLMYLAKERPLKLGDIPKLGKEMQATTLFSKFEEERLNENKRTFKKEESSKKVSKEELKRKIKVEYNILKTIFILVKKDLIIACTTTFIYDCGIYLIPYLTKLLISKFKNVQKFNFTIFIYMISLLILTPFLGLLKQNSMHYTKKTKAASGQILRSIFYNKLKNSDYIFLEKVTPSFVSNILNMEIDKICDFIGMIPKIISTPFSLIISYYFMYISITYLVWLPITLFLSLSLIKIYIKILESTVINQYSNLNAKRADIIEFLAKNIRLVKLNSMENLYKRVLEDLRKEELTMLRRIHNYDSLINFIDIMYPLISASVSIGFYNKVTGQVLNSVSTYNLVSVTAVSKGAFGTITKIVEAVGYYIPTMEAFDTFLEKINEKSDFEIPQDLLETKEESSFSNLKVELNNCDFYFDYKSAKDILKLIETKSFRAFGLDDDNENNGNKVISDFLGNLELKKLIPELNSHEREINLRQSSQQAFLKTKEKISLKKGLIDITISATEGSRICLISSKDSTERTLLYSILQESAMGKGEMIIKGKTGILDSRNPNVFNATMRENIIVGKDFIQDKYERVIDLVKLDIKKYQNDDLTEVLEGGSNLTKLEIKKILIARVLYSEINVLLLNEFFEDIELDVEKEKLFKILEKEFNNGILIFATDNLDFVKRATKIYILENGKIIDEGTYQELRQNKSSFLNELIRIGYFHQSEVSGLNSQSKKTKYKKGNIFF